MSPSSGLPRSVSNPLHSLPTTKSSPPPLLPPSTPALSPPHLPHMQPTPDRENKTMSFFLNVHREWVDLCKGVRQGSWEQKLPSKQERCLLGVHEIMANGWGTRVSSDFSGCCSDSSGCHNWLTKRLYHRPDWGYSQKVKDLLPSEDLCPRKEGR